MATPKKPQYGVYYRSNGRWTGPYANLAFCKYFWKRNPLTSELKMLKNKILKSRVQLRRVAS